jgi:hypothetical protein
MPDPEDTEPLTVMTQEQAQSTLSELGDVVQDHGAFAIAVLLGRTLTGLLAISVLEEPREGAAKLLAASRLRETVGAARTHVVLCRGC